MSLLLDSVIKNNELEMCIGKDDNTLNDEELYSKVIAKQKITLYDKFYVANKNTWQTGNILNEYPSANSHYIADNKVFLCIQNNNGGTTTVKPNKTSKFNFTTSDGYVWRYLFTIQTDDLLNYIRLVDTFNAISIKNSVARPSNYDLSALTFDTQPTLSIISTTGNGATVSSTYDNTTKKLNNVYVTNGGNNYSERDYLLITETATGSGGDVQIEITNGVISVTGFTPGGNYIAPKVHVIGDGTGAEIANTVESGSINSATLTNGGSGYTWAKVVIAPSQNSFVSKIVLESSNGFGYNTKNDILGAKLIINKTFKFDVDTQIDFVMLTSIQLANEIPEIYTVNKHSIKTLSNLSENDIKVIITET